MITRLIVESMLPSSSPSSTPVTVTVWGVFQSPVVNVSGAPTVASPESLDDAVITTLPTGFELSTTVNVSVVPDSFTDVDPPDSATVNPGASKQFIPSPSLILASLPRSVTSAVPLRSLARFVPTSNTCPFLCWKRRRPSQYQAFRKGLLFGKSVLRVRSVTVEPVAVSEAPPWVWYLTITTSPALASRPTR